MHKQYHIPMENVIDILEKRGFIDALTSEEIRVLVSRPQNLYVGFDPTGDGLHLGHLIPMIGLAWFAKMGHRPVAVVGGATAMIGDPSGKSQERNLLTHEQIESNKIGIRADLRNVLKSDVPLLDNWEWYKDFNLIDFLRDVAKYFRVGQMLSKESVKLRMQSQEGISFTEFSYQVLQGYDFLYLYDAHNITIQMGGSDQWGNIVAGVELIRKVHGKSAFGITFPLLMRSDGKKFGKTEGGAIWLSAEKTSPYEFYQYLYGVPDNDVVTLMKRLTFMPLPEIEQWQETMGRPGYKPGSAQAALASAVTIIVHGEAGLASALAMTRKLAPGGEALLDRESLEALAREGICHEMEAIIGLKIVDLLVESGLQSSKSEARKLIANGGVSLNNVKISDVAATVTAGDLLEGEFLLLSVGKKQRRLLQIKTS